MTSNIFIFEKNPLSLGENLSQEKQLSAIRQEIGAGNQFNFYILTPIEDETQEISQITNDDDKSQIIILPTKPDLNDTSINQTNKSESQHDFVNFTFIDKIGNNKFDLEVKSNQKIQSLDYEINSKCKFNQHRVEYILAGRKIQPDEIASDVFLRNRRKRPIYVFETYTKLEEVQNSPKEQSAPKGNLPDDVKLNNFYSKITKKFGHEKIIFLIPYTIGRLYTYKFEGSLQIDDIIAFLYNEFQPLLSYNVCIIDKDSQIIDSSTKTKFQNNQILFYGRDDNIPDELPEITNKLTEFIALHQKSKEIYDKIQKEFKQNKKELINQIWIQLNSLNSQLYKLEGEVKNFYHIVQDSSKNNQNPVQSTTRTTKKDINIDLQLLVIEDIDNTSDSTVFKLSVPEMSTFGDVTNIIYKEHPEFENFKFSFKDSTRKDIFVNERARKYTNQIIYAIYGHLQAKLRQNKISDNSQEISKTKFTYNDSFYGQISISSSETLENIEKQIYDYFNCCGPVKFDFSPSIANGLKDIPEVQVYPLNAIHLYAESRTPSGEGEFYDTIIEFNTNFVAIYDCLKRKGKVSSDVKEWLVVWQEKDVTNECPSNIGLEELKNHKQILIVPADKVKSVKDEIQKVMDFLSVDRNTAAGLVKEYGSANSAINSYLGE